MNSQLNQTTQGDSHCMSWNENLVTKGHTGQVSDVRLYKLSISAKTLCPKESGQRDKEYATIALVLDSQFISWTVPKMKSKTAICLIELSVQQ